MKKKNQPFFGNADLNSCVVYTDLDGATYSAKIVEVRQMYVVVAYHNGGLFNKRITVPRADWNRLTRFGNNMFIVVGESSGTGHSLQPGDNLYAENLHDA